MVSFMDQANNVKIYWRTYLVVTILSAFIGAGALYLALPRAAPQQTVTATATQEVNVKDLGVRIATVKEVVAANVAENASWTQKESVLLGTAPDGSAILGWKEVTYNLNVQDLTAKTVVTETQELQQTQTDVKTEVSVIQHTSSLSRYYATVGIHDTWSLTEVRSCGGTVGLGCLKLLHFGAGARIGDLPVFLGAEASWQWVSLGVKYEWGM